MATTRRPTTTRSIPLEQGHNIAAHYRKQSVIPAYNEDDYTMDVGNGKVVNRVIASGVVEALPMLIGSAIAGLWAASQKSDIFWALGETGVGFFVAGGSRNNSLVRDVSLGIMTGGSVVLVLRALNKLKLANGQQ